MFTECYWDKCFQADQELELNETVRPAGPAGAADPIPTEEGSAVHSSVAVGSFHCIYCKSTQK